MFRVSFWLIDSTARSFSRPAARPHEELRRGAGVAPSVGSLKARSVRILPANPGRVPDSPQRLSGSTSQGPARSADEDHGRARAPFLLGQPQPIDAGGGAGSFAHARDVAARVGRAEIA